MCCWGLLKFCCPVKRSPESSTPDHRIVSLYSAGQRGEESTRVVDEISRISQKFSDGLYYGLPSYKDNFGKQAIKHITMGPHLTSEYLSTNHQHAVWSAKIQAAQQLLLTSWNGQVSQNHLDLYLFRL